MLRSVRRRRALVGAVVISALAASVALADAGAALAQPAFAPVLPLARGKLLVSLGNPPQWLPESGTPTGLTLFSGAPRSARAAAYNAYIALQRGSRRCAATPAGDHESLLEIPSYYTTQNLIAHQSGSPFAGAQAGDYAVTLPGITVRLRRLVRACVWIAATEHARSLRLSEPIQLLNGLFAATVSALPSASSGVGGAYTLNAIDVGAPFRYAVTTTQCGIQYHDASAAVADGTIATESVAIESNQCAGDGSTYSFTSATGGALGSLSYSVAQAIATKPTVATVGACELDPISVIPLADATQYVQAVGCRVRRLLLAPYDPALPRGAVIEAQVDGGLAELAPSGTAVDLELNGRPALAVSGRR
jgi:hypothetical protein